jgi:hypothetical protein
VGIEARRDTWLSRNEFGRKFQGSVEVIAKRKTTTAARINGFHEPESLPDELPTVDQQIAAVRTAINAASAAHILLLTANPTAGTGSAILAVGRALPALAKAIYQLRKHAEEK